MTWGDGGVAQEVVRRGGVGWGGACVVMVVMGEGTNPATDHLHHPKLPLPTRTVPMGNIASTHRLYYSR